MLPPRPRLSRYSLLSLSEKRTDLYLADLSPGPYFDPDLEESAGLVGVTGCLQSGGACWGQRRGQST